MKILEKEHKISRVHLIREELEMQVLHSLSRESWSKNLLFYGGTALRLAYDSPRFSEDLDLFIMKSTKFSDFKKWILSLSDQLPYDLEVKDLHKKRKTYFALLLISHPESKHAIPLKLEVFRNVEKYPVPATELRLLKSKVSPLSPLLLVATLEALKEMKVQTLHERSKARDLYDLWYIDQLLRQPFEISGKLPKYRKRLFSNELQTYLPKNHHSIIPQLWKSYESAHKKTS